MAIFFLIRFNLNIAKPPRIFRIIAQLKQIMRVIVAYLD